ncbi:SSI family serine proteinase inhibitor [Streptomyces deserti]
MTHTSAKAVRAGLLAAAVLVVACATPAQATARHPVPGNWLFLTVTRGDAPSAVTHGTLLVCDPPRGHTRAADACAELDAAGGDIGGIPPKDGYCPMVYAPVTVHARGQWRGRPIAYRQQFPNPCVMAARTGTVFALDATT